MSSPNPTPPLRRMMRNALLWALAAGALTFCVVILIGYKAFRHYAFPGDPMPFKKWAATAFDRGSYSAIGTFVPLAIKALYRHVTRNRKE